MWYKQNKTGASLTLCHVQHALVALQQVTAKDELRPITLLKH
jgi:hypothetical protein